MKAPLEIIAELGAPTDSYIAAVNYFNYRDVETQSWYEEQYNAIIGTEQPVVFGDRFQARYHFLYAVQETVRAYATGVIPEMADVASEVERRVAALQAKSPWMFKDYDATTSNGEPKVDALGKPKPKKGAKKDLAKQVYAEFIKGKNLSRKDAIAIMAEKVGLTPAGASTYYANCKAGRF